MQSYLGEYKNAASNRPDKLRRAIDSVLNQSFTDWELLVIADGCEKTFDIVSEYDDERIDCRMIRKTTMWSGAPRNYGLSQAKGEIVVYLDADDYLGKDHLKIIDQGFADYDWTYFNDWVKTTEGQIERECLIQVKYQFGTSNIAHKRSLNAKWTTVGYGSDDWSLVQHLKKLSSNYAKISTPEYIVCHIPNKIDL